MLVKLDQGADASGAARVPTTYAATPELMSDSLRSNLDRRRYRIAQAAIVGGSLALGSLVVNRLVAFLREDFFLYYGASDYQYAELQQNSATELPLTVGQSSLVVIALFVVCGFLAAERRRVRQAADLDRACRSRNTEFVVERLSLGSVVESFVLRTSAFAGVLLSLWLLQSSAERWLGGYGWGIEYVDWRSLLPLASIFGVCVLASLLVAATSLVGVRAITVLELVLAKIGRRRREREVRVPAYVVVDTVRTVRERMGCDILSRPPPVRGACTT